MGSRSTTQADEGLCSASVLFAPRNIWAFIQMPASRKRQGAV